MGESYKGLDCETRWYIEDLTLEILKHCKMQISCTNIDIIVLNMGGSIKYTSFNSGVRKTSCGFEIQVASYLKKGSTLANKAVAELLGFTILHLGYKINMSLWNKQPLNIPIVPLTKEQWGQIEYFRDCLLLPEGKFLNSLSKNQTGRFVNIANMANELRVSLSDIDRRGRQLGIEWTINKTEDIV